MTTRNYTDLHPKKKKRLDKLILRRGFCATRQRAQALIMSGKILVNNQPIDKPGTLVSENAEIILKGEDNPYVSRGGLKLEKALQHIGIDISGFVCLDVGASTGGFTDCLLQHGARRVFAVDVGYGQLAWKLRRDLRVVVIERTNIRYLAEDAIPQRVDLVTIDVSFISLKIVVPATLKFVKDDAAVLALIKPQFEVGRGRLGKGGVVRDPSLHQSIIQELTDFFSNHNLASQAVIPSPLPGPKGNREFFIFLKYSRYGS